MTTQNHTLLAGVAAVAYQDAPSLTKTGVIVGLIVSHLIVDAIPHRHLYSFDDLPSSNKLSKLGALVELGGGLLVLTLIIGLVFNLDWLWLSCCVIAASLFDFLVAANIAPIKRLNIFAHWWTEKTSRKVQIIFEICQTIVLVVALTVLINANS